MSAKLRRVARLVTAPAFVLAITVCGGETKKTGAGPQLLPSADKGLASDDLSSVVNSVEIVPPALHAVVGAKVQIEAIARTAGGVPIANPGTIAWSTAVSISSTSSNPTTLTASNAGTHAISVSVAGKPAPVASLIVARANQGGSDKVTVAHANGSSAAAVLIDANEIGGAGAVQTTANCQHNDLRYSVAGTAVLKENLTSGCPIRLAILSPGHAVRFECHRAAGRPNCAQSLASLWSNAADSVGRNSLPGPIAVELVVWLRASAETTVANVIAKGDANYATSIYSDQRAAMQFNIVKGQGGANGSVRSLWVSDTATDECENVEQTLDIDAVEGSVNVVYVENILFNAAPRAITCDRDVSLPPIIVMRYYHASTTTLAHELGHVMGLMRKWFNDFDGGHTYNVPGFDATNFMWTQTNATYGLAPDQISLGQAFRMHVDARSWVNVQRDGPVGGPNKLPRIRGGDTETCQPERTAPLPCPKLSLRP